MSYLCSRPSVKLYKLSVLGTKAVYGILVIRTFSICPVAGLTCGVASHVNEPE